MKQRVSRSLLILAFALTHPVQSFLVRQPPFAFTTHRAATATPTKVEDPDGPTPVIEPPEIPVVDPETIDGLKEIHRVEDLHVAVEGQPWRRGDTAGCDAPISAQWRKDAEDLIKYAVEFVGGKVLDITWYLTVLLVTIDDELLPPKDLLKYVILYVSQHNCMLTRFYEL